MDLGATVPHFCFQGNMKAYISATAAITPQATFEAANYLPDLQVAGKEYFAALEPDYKQFIDPKLSRRMARIIKMSVTSAKVCLERAGVTLPGAVIVGTGLGCLQDTEKFLVDILENNEGLLSPTSFIQSTHNTIAGQIALTLNCTSHNFTFAQRGHSFEQALEDALLLIEEGSENVLVGGVDEVTPTLVQILKNAIPAKENPEASVDQNSPSQPIQLGEGAVFFTLSANPRESPLACIDGFRMFFNPGSADDMIGNVEEFLRSQKVEPGEIDAVMMGFQSTEPEDIFYNKLQEVLFKDKLILSYKNLCGEYFTSSAFGHQLVANMLDRQEIFPGTYVSGNADSPINKLLFYSHTNGKYHTLTLFSRCQPL